MSDTITIRLDEPRPCCRLIAIRRRCGEMATLARATRLADGSYHMQPFCWFCLTDLGLQPPMTEPIHADGAIQETVSAFICPAIGG